MSGVAAGLHVIARLPERHRPLDRFLERAAAAQVAVRSLAAYKTTTDDDVRLVLGDAHLTPTRIRDSARALEDATRA